MLKFSIIGNEISPLPADSKPAIILSNVVFPQPLGPNIEIISPFLRDSLSAEKTTLSSNSLVSISTCKNASSFAIKNHFLHHYDEISQQLQIEQMSKSSM